MPNHQPPSQKTGFALIALGLLPILLISIYLVGSNLGCERGFSTSDPLDYASSCDTIYAAAAHFTFISMFAWPLVILWIVVFLISGAIFVFR